MILLSESVFWSPLCIIYRILFLLFTGTCDSKTQTLFFLFLSLEASCWKRGVFVNAYKRMEQDHALSWTFHNLGGLLQQKTCSETFIVINTTGNVRTECALQGIMKRKRNPRKQQQTSKMDLQCYFKKSNGSCLGFLGICVIYPNNSPTVIGPETCLNPKTSSFSGLY